MYGSPKSDPNNSVRVCVYILQQTGRAVCTLYTSFTTPRLLTDVHQAVEYNVQ